MENCVRMFNTSRACDSPVWAGVRFGGAGRYMEEGRPGGRAHSLGDTWLDSQP
jgi:hypothetical protein